MISVIAYVINSHHNMKNISTIKIVDTPNIDQLTSFFVLKITKIHHSQHCVIVIIITWPLHILYQTNMFYEVKFRSSMKYAENRAK